MTAAPPLLLRDALLADGRRVDVRVAGGVVADVTPAGGVAGGVDLAGALLLPGFAEAHGHVDKALVGALGAGPGLGGALAAWDRHRSRRTVAETRDRARAALLEYARHGTTTVRTHVDVAGTRGAEVVAALADLRRSLAGLVRLELVAMPATPLTGPAAAATLGHLADALAAGADLVGGAPWVDTDPRAATAALVEVAAAHGTGLDLHVDESLSPERPALGHVLAAVEAGFPGEVTVGHLVGLGQADEDVQRAVAASLARAGVTVVTNPRSNLWLQERERASGARRGLTAVRALLDAGVRLRAGGDNLRDPFSPYGSADPLAVAQLLALAAPVAASEALAAVTATGGLVPAAGAPADLVALPAADVEDAVARVPGARLVVRAGRVVARRRVVDEWVPPAGIEPALGRV